MKMIFMKDTLHDNKQSQWKRDEVRIFMHTAKKSITSSKKPYYVKVFDLFSRKLVNVYKFSTKEYGWKTINLTGWRNIKPKDRKGRVGLKFVVLLGKKKLKIANTAFRKSKLRHEPYFIEFLHPKNERISLPKGPQGTSLIDKYRKIMQVLPTSTTTKSDIKKRDYFLPFPRYERWGLE